MEIITNHQPRLMLYGSELTEKERAEFDYMDDIEEGKFFRYKGRVYDLGEFLIIDDNAPEKMRVWDGYSSDSYFSGVLIKVSDCGDYVTCATYIS